MHHTISYQLAQARLKLRRRKPRPAVRPLTKRTVLSALIAATLCALAVGTLAPRASAGAAVGAGSGGVVAFVPIVEPPNPRCHRVAPGAVYLFSIDYSTISYDPHAARGTGGYGYAPLGHVRAEWTGR